jgi:hypothetical protein
VPLQPDVNALVKIKNPSLLLQLQKAPAPAKKGTTFWEQR